MAQIKMDISEYESMKENKKLLEDSLENERKLKKQIDILNQEKIDALKQSSKQIVKENKTIVIEHKLVRKDLNVFMRNLLRKIGVNPNYADNLRANEFGGVETIVDELFDNTYTTKPKQSIEIIGLDDAKIEIKNILTKEFEEELAELNSLKENLLNKDNLLKDRISKLKNAHKYIEELKEVNLIIDENNRDLQLKVNELSEKLEKFKYNEKAIDLINNVIHKDNSIFKRNVLRKIKEILNLTKQ